MQKDSQHATTAVNTSRNNGGAKATTAALTKITKNTPAPPPSRQTQPNSAANHQLQQQKSFAFGSSTPREFSHISKVTRYSRQNDALKANGLKNGGDNERNLSYYMRQARSITPGNISGRTKCWAFGSSTPREFSHLNRLTANQRIYNAKNFPNQNFVESKSALTFAEKNAKPKRSLPDTQRQQDFRRELKTLNKPQTPSDDAASEPDFVQDRERLVDMHKNLGFPVQTAATSQAKEVPLKAESKEPTPPNKSSSNNKKEDPKAATGKLNELENVETLQKNKGDVIHNGSGSKDEKKLVNSNEVAKASGIIHDEPNQTKTETVNNDGDKPPHKGDHFQLNSEEKAIPTLPVEPKNMNTESTTGTVESQLELENQKTEKNNIHTETKLEVQTDSTAHNQDN